MSDSRELDVVQSVTMSAEARQRLRATAVGHDIPGGPFARVLIAAALDLMEKDSTFADQIAQDVADEKQRYKKSG